MFWLVRICARHVNAVTVSPGSQSVHERGLDAVMLACRKEKILILHQGENGSYKRLLDETRAPLSHAVPASLRGGCSPSESCGSADSNGLQTGDHIWAACIVVRLLVGGKGGSALRKVCE